MRRPGRSTRPSKVERARGRSWFLSNEVSRQNSPCPCAFALARRSSTIEFTSMLVTMRPWLLRSTTVESSKPVCSSAKAGTKFLSGPLMAKASLGSPRGHNFPVGPCVASPLGQPVGGYSPSTVGRLVALVGRCWSTKVRVSRTRATSRRNLSCFDTLPGCTPPSSSTWPN